jgi:UDP-N-acetylmuramate dehydrogenase
VSSRGISPEKLQEMETAFGERLRQGISLAPYTSSRIGGPADFLIEVRSADQLAQTTRLLWMMEMPFRILGGGSNVLISDRGVRGAIVLNRAQSVEFIDAEPGPFAKAESGAAMGSLCRRAVERDWSGMEWAATIPGTVGGALVGNAGAHGGDIASCLHMAEILQRKSDIEVWPVKRFEYGYRDSWLKRHSGEAAILTATFLLRKTSPNMAKAIQEEFIAYRHRTQPAGASWGSIFKNPAGKSAGRLIEAAGLKGLQIGGVRISPKHANFFINLGDASASDVMRLIKAVQKEVAERFNILLELEIDLLGDWEPELVEGIESQGGEL